jgi:triacylglycerol lipase
MVTNTVDGFLPVLAPGRDDPNDPGAWRRAAEQVAEALRAAGNALAAPVGFVDGDVKRELSTLPLMALFSIGRRSAPVRALPDDGRRPVVFVHGLAGHPANFRALSLYLRRKGHRRLYSIGLRYGVGIEGQAEHLREFIAQVVAVNELRPGQVDVVAHSRGGLVSRLALECSETAGRIATLVTLGTPHRGTIAARWGRGKELDELRTDSELMLRLRRQLPWQGPRLVCLWSNTDPLVYPPHHAQVPGATNVELDDLGHCQLLLKPAGWRAAHQAIMEDQEVTDESESDDTPEPRRRGLRLLGTRASSEGASDEDEGGEDEGGEAGDPAAVSDASGSDGAE